MMSIPMALPSDLIDLLAEFAATGVEYLLVGGQALALHGLPRFTKDADVWLRDSADNIQRAQQALLSFGAPRNVVDALATAAPLDVVWMGAPPARIDLMKGVPGGDFARAWAARVAHTVAGTCVLVVSRDELVRLNAPAADHKICSMPSSSKQSSSFSAAWPDREIWQRLLGRAR